MKRVCLFIASLAFLSLLILLGIPAHAQPSNPAIIYLLSASSLPSTCTGFVTWEVVGTPTLLGTIYTCQAGVPTAVGGGSGTFNALTGDATSTATGGATTVKGINGTLLSSLASCVLYNTTTTGAISCATNAEMIAALGSTPAINASAMTNFPTFNQNTTGNASTATAATNMAGGALGSAPYQNAANTTLYVPSPTVNGVYSYGWNISGSAAAAPVSFQITGAGVSCTGSPLVCTFSGGTGSGTVNSGTAYSPAYYASTGTAVSGTTPFTGLEYWAGSAAPAAATAAQVVAAIGTTAVTNSTNTTNLLGGTANEIAYQTGVGATGFITAAASCVLLTSSGNVPSCGTTLPAVSGSAITSLNAGNVSSGTLAAARGGTGVSNTATLTLGTSNQNWASLGTGIVKNTTTTGAITDAAAADVYGLWSGTCSSSTFLRGDGACAAPSGSGTVNSGTSGHVGYYASSGTAISSDSNLDDGATTPNTLTYAGSGGITASAGPLTSGNPSGGVGSSDFLTQEGTVPSGFATAGQDNIYADSTQHGLLSSFNGGATLPLVQGPASNTSGDVADYSGTNGGKIVDSGVVAANLVVASSPGAGIAHFAGSTQTVTSSTIATGDIAANAVTLAKLATQGANTVLANVTGSTAVPTAATIPAGVQFYTAATGYSAATSANLLGVCTTCVTSAASLTSTDVMTGAGSQGAQTDANATLSAGALSLGASGTLGSIALGNATSGVLTVEPATGAITSYTLQLPVAQPSGSNTFLSCTAANPSVCTFAAGGGGVTSVATTGPITGGPITATGTIACATCVTSAASLTSNALMTGAGSQGSQTITTGTGVTTALGNATNGTGGLLTQPGLTSNVIPKSGGATSALVATSITDNGTTVTSTDTGGYVAPVFVANGTTAGFGDYPQGTTSVAVAPCNTATSICEQAPTAVTSYLVVKPGVAANGVETNNVASAVDTQGFSGDTNHSAVVSTSTATSVSSTSLCSTTFCPAGTYRVSAYIDVTTACTTTGSYLVSIIYTDDTTASKTIVMPLIGTGVTATLLGPTANSSSLAESATTNFGQGSMILRSTGAASINYSTTAGACGTGGPGLGKLYLNVEPIG